MSGEVREWRGGSPLDGVSGGVRYPMSHKTKHTSSKREKDQALSVGPKQSFGSNFSIFLKYFHMALNNQYSVTNHTKRSKLDIKLIGVCKVLRLR